MIDSYLRKSIYYTGSFLKSKNFLTNLNNFRDSLNLSRESIEEVQQANLKKIIMHSYKYSKYYQQEFEKIDLVKNDCIDLSKFSKLPILEKRDIKENFDLIKSSKLFKGAKVNASGGSTGEPTQFIQDDEYRDAIRAVSIGFDEWAGTVIGDKKLILWGAVKDFTKYSNSLGSKIYNSLFGVKYLNTWRMTVDEINQYIKIINTYKPDHILAYAESLYEISKYAKIKQIKVFKPKSIITSAGTLFPYMRESIEEVFQTKVNDRYGSREFGGIACQCNKHKGFHIATNNNLVEVVRPDGTISEPGEEGDIVITSLVNYSFPLIRYRIGDRGVLSNVRCDCTNPYPILEKITGRVTDYFSLKNESKIRIPTSPFYSKLFIKKFQIIQESFEDYKVYLVIEKEINELNSFSNKDIREIDYILRSLLGEGCKIDFKFVDEIPLSKSGKHQYAISNIKE